MVGTVGTRHVFDGSSKQLAQTRAARTKSRWAPGGWTDYAVVAHSFVGTTLLSLRGRRHSSSILVALALHSPRRRLLRARTKVMSSCLKTSVSSNTCRPHWSQWLSPVAEGQREPIVAVGAGHPATSAPPRTVYRPPLGHPRLTEGVLLKGVLCPGVEHLAAGASLIAGGHVAARVDLGVPAAVLSKARLLPADGTRHTAGHLEGGRRAGRGR